MNLGVDFILKNEPDSLIEILESFGDKFSLDSILIVQPAILIAGYGEFGANVIRVLNDLALPFLIVAMYMSCICLTYIFPFAYM